MTYNSSKTNTKCVYAHGAVCVSTDGFVKPCCHLKIGRELPPFWNENHIEHPWWKSLLHNLDNGVKDERCQKCWDLEELGNASMRMNTSGDYSHHANVTTTPWSYLDLKLGTKCNLMCNMCDANASSLIAKEQWENIDEGWLRKAGPSKLQVEGYEDPNNTPFIQKGRAWREYERAGYTDKLQWWQNPKFYDKIKENAKDIRTLKFTGGEPTLIPQVHEIMDYMLESGHADHINITITTNGTYKGTDIYEKMCRFKSARVNLSVDGTGDVYNYIRYPHTWKRWENNTKKLVELCKSKAKTNASVRLGRGYQSKLKVNYQFTTSVFNLFNIREMEDWILTTGGWDNGVTVNYHPNYVFNPKWQNIRYLPWDTLDRAVVYLKDGHRISNAIIRFIWGGEDISDEEKAMQMEKLKYDTELKDRIRVKRPNWDTIDNDMLRLKDIMYG